MKRTLALVVLAVALGAGCTKNSTAPTSGDTGNTATNATYTAQLSPANEVPPVGGAESTGSGSVTITVKVTKDANGAPVSATVDFVANFSGFPAGTALTAAHIHPGVAGTNGGVLVSTNLASGEVTFPNGSGSLSKTGLTLPVDQATAIQASPASYYFNIHTAANPGGVARGQLVKQ